MKKILSLFLISLVIFMYIPQVVYASDKVYEVTYAGYARNRNISSSTTSYYIDTYRNTKVGYFMFQIPASDVEDGQVMYIDSRRAGGFSTLFYWSGLNLLSTYKNGYGQYVDFWSSSDPGSKSTQIYSSWTSMSQFVNMDGTGKWSPDFQEYDAGIHVFKPTVYKTSGYYYITGNTASSGAYDPTIFHVIVCDPDDVPEDKPVPSLPPAVGDVGSSSEEVGSFGDDDGSGNWVYESFMRLYNSLVGISSDTSVPDMNLPDSAFADFGKFSQKVSLPAVLINENLVYNVQLSTVMPIATTPTEYSVVFDNQSISNRSKRNMDVTYYVDPFFVEISETGVVQNEPPSGHSYVLRYRQKIPIRFYYGNHVGTGLSSEDVMFNMSLQYDMPTVSGKIIGSYQFGEPTFYIESNGDFAYNYATQVSRVDSSTSSGKWLDDTIGFKLLYLPVNDDTSKTYNLVVEWNLYVSEIASNTVFVNPQDYQSRFIINWAQYNNNLEFKHLSDSSIDSTLQDIYKEQVQQGEREEQWHQEEMDKTDEAVDGVNGGLDDVTSSLTAWEIFTMPFTLLKDFVKAITSDGETTLTFPSVQIMGYTIWPSYSFNLNVIAERFPLLVNSMHIIFGIMVCLAFIKYLWLKWNIITGDRGGDE